MNPCILKEHSKKSLVLNCSNIMIQQLDSVSPLSFQGSGLIFQDKDGELQLKLFLSNLSGDESIGLTNILQFKRGANVIPADRFFTLAASPIEGGVWTTDKFLPVATVSLDAGSAVVQGRLHRITQVRQPTHKISGSVMTLHFYSDISFPANTSTKAVEEIDNQVISKSSSLNVAKFDSIGMKFTLSKRDGIAKLKIESPKENLPENLRVRVCEALSFVFGWEAIPEIVERIHGIEERTEVSSYYRTTGYSNSHPPLNPSYDWLGKNLWCMFDRYLAHIMKEPGDDWHPLSNSVIPIIRSLNGPLDSLALVLTVAVEGIVKQEFPTAVATDAALLEETKKLEELVKNSELSDNFKNRVNGTFSSFKSSSAKDKLHFLVKDGKLRERLVKRWSGLRNSQAHAAILSPDKFEQHLADCYTSRTLLNELIFFAIGYEGIYTDFSEPDRPIRQIDSTTTVDLKPNT